LKQSFLSSLLAVTKDENTFNKSLICDVQAMKQILSESNIGAFEAGFLVNEIYQNREKSVTGRRRYAHPGHGRSPVIAQTLLLRFRRKL